MGFRKSKEAELDEVNWSNFCAKQSVLIRGTGLPSSYIEEQSMFVDFLMHGRIAHDEDSIKFSYDSMNNTQQNLLLILVQEYFKAGFSNPGLGIFSQDDIEALEEILESSD